MLILFPRRALKNALVSATVKVNTGLLTENLNSKYTSIGISPLYCKLSA